MKYHTTENTNYTTLQINVLNTLGDDDTQQVFLEAMSRLKDDPQHYKAEGIARRYRRHADLIRAGLRVAADNLQLEESPDLESYILLRLKRQTLIELEKLA